MCLQIKDNKDKIKLNNQLPYLVGNVVEVLEMQPEDDEEDDGANIDLDAQRRGKCVVLKTSTRQTIFLPVVGLVDAEALKPADLVGVNKVTGFLAACCGPCSFTCAALPQSMSQKMHAMPLYDT
jgi:ATP-dependent 26S proteasome regulatory subunit